MAGEILRIQTGDGVDHLIDYLSLANRPDTDAMAQDIADLKEALASVIAALDRAGIPLDAGDADVSDGTLALDGNGYEVANGTLSLPNATVSGTKLVIGGSGGTSVSGGTLSMGNASVSDGKLAVSNASVSDGKLSM